jgi:hypothetical protein
VRAVQQERQHVLQAARPGRSRPRGDEGGPVGRVEPHRDERQQATLLQPEVVVGADRDVLERTADPLAASAAREGVGVGEPSRGVGQRGRQRPVLLGRDVQRPELLGRQDRPQPRPQHGVLGLLVGGDDPAQQRPARLQCPGLGGR